MKLTPWNSHIEAVPKGGVYNIQDIRLNRFTGRYLTTNAATVIKTSETVIKK